MTDDDLSLLRQYARHNSEEAFATLVSRHVNLVYSVALRSVNDTHLAEDVTQAVFVILSRKAGSLGDKTILPAWLCRTAHYASSETLRNQRRRQWREQEASMQPISNEPHPDLWPDIKPLLNGAMETLGRKDYDALVLRFFENKNFAEVGASLGASEDAAKMRVHRALEKLRNFFAKRGVDSSASAIGKTIAANSIQAAPLTLAKSVTAVTLLKGAVTSTSTLTLIKGTLKLMAWSQAKTVVAVGVAVILAASVSTIVIKAVSHSPAKFEMRVFNVDPVFTQNLRTITKSPVDAPVSDIFSDYLLSKGINIRRAQRAVAFDAPRSLLFIRATPSEMDAIERIVGQLNIDLNVVQVHIKSRFYAIPDEILPGMNIEWTADSQGGQMGYLDVPQLRNILIAMRASGVVLIGVPEEVLSNGRQTRMRMTEPFFRFSDLTRTNIGAMLDAIPYYSTNSSTFNITIDAEVNLLSGDVSQPTVQTIQITNQVTLASDNTLVLEQPIPTGSWLPNMKNVPPGPRDLLVMVTADPVDSAGNLIRHP